MDAASVTQPLLTPPLQDHVCPPPEQANSNDVEDEYSHKGKKRHLEFFDGVALVLGLQIGSGIFASPSLVARNAGSEPVALLIWCIAGFLAWACAVCYVELGIRMPVNGGPQEYLAYCFNDLLGFLASWACIFTVKPCSAAILALVISDYVCDAFGLGKGILDFQRKLGALLVLAMVAIVNCSGNHLSSLATKSLLACKILGVGFIIVLGSGVLLFQSNNSPVAVPDTEQVTPRMGLSNYMDALLSAMWAYSGWETLAFVGGELKNPERNIALVINVSMTVVILLSVLANIAYFSVLSFEDIINSTTIGLTFCQHFLGHASSILYTLVICLSTLGALNIKIFTGARLTQAAAERQFLPPIIRTIGYESHEHSIEELWDGQQQPQRFFALLRQPKQFGDGSIPFSAIIFNALLAIAYVLIGDFSSLIIFIGIVEYTVAFATLLGLLYLRLSRKSTEVNGASLVSFRVPWLLILVALFATVVMVSISIFRHPVAGIGFFAFCILSSAIYTRYIRASRPLTP